MDTKFVSNYNTILLKCEIMNYLSINMISKHIIFKLIRDI